MKNCDSWLEAAVVGAMAEEAKTYRHLLDIAQQVYGLEGIGDAFTEIDKLRARIATLEAQNAETERYWKAVLENLTKAMQKGGE